MSDIVDVHLQECVSKDRTAAITAVFFCKDMRAPQAKLSLFILNIYNYMCACTVVQLGKFSSQMSLFLKFFQVVMFILVKFSHSPCT